MKENVTRVLLNPEGKPIAYGKDAWECLDQAGIAAEDDWDKYIEQGFKLCQVTPMGTGLAFTPGIPTEDGWYVVKVTDPRGDYYAATKVLRGFIAPISPDTEFERSILSHAKLPEL
jgi:hypothetical protein